MNNQASSAIGVLLTMWGVGISIFGIQLAEQNILPRYVVFILMFGACGAFFMSQLFLLPMSVKSGENIRQLSSLSTYIKVFYIYPSLHFPHQDNGKSRASMYSWESADKILNIVFTKPNQYGQAKSFPARHTKLFFNLEYTLLGFAATVFILILLAVNYPHIVASQHSVLIFIIAAILLLFSVIIVVIVCLFSNSPKELITLPDLYLKVYLAYAYKIGFLSKDEVKNALVELSPNACLTPEDYDAIIRDVT